MLIAPIDTPRLQLRILLPEHASLLQQYLLRNREYLAPWEPLRDSAFFTIEQCQERLLSNFKLMHAGLGMFFAICDAEDMVGMCNFSNIVRGAFQACHLGYSIAKTHQGQGYMSEAATAGIDYMFAHAGLHRIMANYVPENTRSAALLQRLGFEREGYAKSYLKINGVWRDHVLTARIHPQQ